MRNIAGDLLHGQMQRAFTENPRGELYRTIPQDKLLDMLEQNIAEVKLALRFNNDVLDKLADCGNYVAFILRNHMDPLFPEEQERAIFKDLVGLSLDQAADVIVRLMKAHDIASVRVDKDGIGALTAGLRGVTHPDNESNRLAHER